jgi:MazG family protein
MAEEIGAFSFADVVAAITDKMIRRHPHVFGNADVKTADAQTAAWEEHKRQERVSRGAGVMDDIPLALPALTRALKIQKRAATVGFDWKEARPIFDKLDEEVGELRTAMAQGASKDKLADELGDILFVVVNIARHLGLKPEDALSGTNRKFLRRFAFVETQARAAGKTLAQLSLEEMEAEWSKAKSLEVEQR